MVSRFSLILPLVLAGCEFVSSPSGRAVHKTVHFNIHYDVDEFTPDEIKRIGEKKERILKSIEEKFQVTYSGVITVQLFYQSIHVHADRLRGIHESRKFVMNDNGHEIAHMVVLETMGGHSSLPFLVEGIAVALEVRLDYINALEAYVNYYKESQRRAAAVAALNNPSRLDTVDTSPAKNKTVNTITSQILIEGNFDFSNRSYLRAGAFTQWLLQSFGEDKFKQLYRATFNTLSPDRINGLFRELFGEPVSILEERFNNLYLN
jgi:hypothetical protein